MSELDSSLHSLIHQKITAQLKISDYNPIESFIPERDSYSIYTLKGESKILEGYSYNLDFVSDDLINVEDITDLDAEIYLRDENNPLKSKRIYGKIVEAKENGSLVLLKDAPFSPLAKYDNENKRYRITQDVFFLNSRISSVRPIGTAYGQSALSKQDISAVNDQVALREEASAPILISSIDGSNEESRKNLQINTKDKNKISKTNYKIKAYYLSEEINIINGEKPTYYFELKDNNGKTYKTKVKTANLKNKSINENFTLQELCKEVELPLAHLVSFFPQVKANYETRWIDPVSYASILINDSWKYNEPLNKIGEDRPEVKDVTSFKKGKNSLDETKLIQEGLLKMDIDLGDYGADRDYGSTTETAVKIFQINYIQPEKDNQKHIYKTQTLKLKDPTDKTKKIEVEKLEETGIVDKNTLLAMDEALVNGWKYKEPEYKKAPWVKTAETQLGVSEYAGKHKENPQIREYYKAGEYLWATDDSGAVNAWCGCFVAWVMKKAGYNSVKNAFRAKSWMLYGKKIDEPVHGAIGIKSRKGGGHTAFIVGKSKDGKYYYMLGGNQSDQVKVSKYKKEDWDTFVVPSEYDTTDAVLPIYTKKADKSGKES